MNLKPILSTAKATCKEGIRNKVFYNILFFGLLIICSSLVLNKMTIGDETKIIKDLGLTAISLFGLLTILFLGTNHIYQEFEQKIIYSVLVKPISRGGYLLGKYFGILSIIAIEIIAMITLTLVLLFTIKGIVFWALLQGVYTIFLELALLCAIGILFSTFMKPQLSTITILAVYIIGHSTSELRIVLGEKGSYLTTRMVEVVYYLFPNFDNFDITSQVVHNLQLAPFHLTLVSLYTIFYTTIVLMISTRVFKRKDF